MNDIYYLLHVGAILIAFGIIFFAGKAFLYPEKKVMHACPECGRGVNFLTFSLYDKSRKICPDCADREWKNRPRRA